MIRSFWQGLLLAAGLSPSPTCCPDLPLLSTAKKAPFSIPAPANLFWGLFCATHPNHGPPRHCITQCWLWMRKPLQICLMKGHHWNIPWSSLCTFTFGSLAHILFVFYPRGKEGALFHRGAKNAPITSLIPNGTSLPASAPAGIKIALGRSGWGCCQLWMQIWVARI